MAGNVNLADLLPEQRFVNVGRGQAEVFPLDITNVGVLLEKHGMALEGLFKEGSQPDFTALVKSMPVVINDVILMSLHAEGQDDLVQRIPLSAKVEILSTVWELSVTDPKKLVAKLKELAEGAKSLRAEIGA